MEWLLLLLLTEKRGNDRQRKIATAISYTKLAYNVHRLTDCELYVNNLTTAVDRRSAAPTAPLCHGNVVRLGRSNNTTGTRLGPADSTGRYIEKHAR